MPKLTAEQKQRQSEDIVRQRKERSAKLLKLWKRGEHSGQTKSGCTSEFVKKYLRRKYNNACAECKWDKINLSTGKSPLEIEHKNGDSTDGSIENVTLLCPNCHSLTPTWKALNKGRANKDRLKRHKLL